MKTKLTLLSLLAAAGFGLTMFADAIGGVVAQSDDNVEEVRASQSLGVRDNNTTKNADASYELNNGGTKFVELLSFPLPEKLQGKKVKQVTLKLITERVTQTGKNVYISPYVAGINPSPQYNDIVSAIEKANQENSQIAFQPKYGIASKALTGTGTGDPVGSANEDIEKWTNLLEIPDYTKFVTSDNSNFCLALSTEATGKIQFLSQNLSDSSFPQNGWLNDLNLDDLKPTLIFELEDEDVVVDPEPEVSYDAKVQSGLTTAFHGDNQYITGEKTVELTANNNQVALIKFDLSEQLKANDLKKVVLHIVSERVKATDDVSVYAFPYDFDSNTKYNDISTNVVNKGDAIATFKPTGPFDKSLYYDDVDAQSQKVSAWSNDVELDVSKFKEAEISNGVYGLLLATTAGNQICFFTPEVSNDLLQNSSKEWVKNINADDLKPYLGLELQEKAVVDPEPSNATKIIGSDNMVSIKARKGNNPAQNAEVEINAYSNFIALYNFNIPEGKKVKSATLGIMTKLFQKSPVYIKAFPYEISSSSKYDDFDVLDSMRESTDDAWTSFIPAGEQNKSLGAENAISNEQYKDANNWLNRIELPSENLKDALTASNKIGLVLFTAEPTDNKKLNFFTERATLADITNSNITAKPVKDEDMWPYLEVELEDVEVTELEEALVTYDSSADAANFVTVKWNTQETLNGPVALSLVATDEAQNSLTLDKELSFSENTLTVDTRTLHHGTKYTISLAKGFAGNDNVVSKAQEITFTTPVKTIFTGELGENMYLPVADTWIKNGDGGNRGGSNSMEIQNPQMGLIGFQLDLPADKKVSKATLHIFFERMKGTDFDFNVYAYENNFTENTGYASEETFITAAKQGTPVTKKVSGPATTTIYENNEDTWADAEKWAYDFDVTDLILNNTRANFLLTADEEGNSQVRVYSKENIGIVWDAKHKIPFWTRELTAKDLVPYLEIETEDVVYDKVDITLKEAIGSDDEGYTKISFTASPKADLKWVSGQTIKVNEIERTDKKYEFGEKDDEVTFENNVITLDLRTLPPAHNYSIVVPEGLLANESEITNELEVEKQYNTPKKPVAITLDDDFRNTGFEEGKIFPSASVQMVASNSSVNTNKETLELRKNANEDDSPLYFGLMNFSMNVPGKQVKSAKLHLVFERVKSAGLSLGIHQIDKNFTESVSFSDMEEEYNSKKYTEADLTITPENSPSNGAIFDKVAQQYSNFDAWSYEIDITEEMLEKAKELGYLNLMLSQTVNNQQLNVYTHKNVGLNNDNGLKGFWTLDITQEDLMPYLEVELEDVPVSSVDAEFSFTTDEQGAATSVEVTWPGVQNVKAQGGAVIKIESESFENPFELTVDSEEVSMNDEGTVTIDLRTLPREKSYTITVSAGFAVLDGATSKEAVSDEFTSIFKQKAFEGTLADNKILPVGDTWLRTNDASTAGKDTKMEIRKNGESQLFFGLMSFNLSVPGKIVKSAKLHVVTERVKAGVQDLKIYQFANNISDDATWAANADAFNAAIAGEPFYTIESFNTPYDKAIFDKVDAQYQNLNLWSYDIVIPEGVFNEAMEQGYLNLMFSQDAAQPVNLFTKENIGINNDGALVQLWTVDITPEQLVPYLEIETEDIPASDKKASAVIVEHPDDNTKHSMIEYSWEGAQKLQISAGQVTAREILPATTVSTAAADGIQTLADVNYGATYYLTADEGELTLSEDGKKLLINLMVLPHNRDYEIALPDGLVTIDGAEVSAAATHNVSTPEKTIYTGEMNEMDRRPIADTWIRESAPDNKNGGAATTLEIQNNGEGNNYIGLLGFNLDIPQGKKITGATLRIITERAKGSEPVVDVYGYYNNFDEGSATWGTEEVHIADAMYNYPLATVVMGGHPTKAFWEMTVPAYAEYADLQLWTNEIDVTDYVVMMAESSQRVNFLIDAQQSSEVRIYTKENTAVSSENAKIPAWLAGFTGKDLMPVLTLSLDDDNETTFETLETTADGHVRNSAAGTSYGNNTSMEIYTNGDNIFAGLVGFQLPEKLLEDGAILKSATFRIVTKRIKGNRNIELYPFTAAFTDGVKWNDVASNVMAALATNPFTIFQVNGEGNKDVEIDDISDSYADIAAWTNYINVTDLLNEMLYDRETYMPEEGFIAFLLNKPSTEQTMFFTKEIGNFTNSKNEANFYASDDLRPQLTLSYLPAGTTSVEEVTVDLNDFGGLIDPSKPVEYYNLQGMKVNNPSNGIYIIRQGNVVAKVMIK